MLGMMKKAMVVAAVVGVGAVAPSVASANEWHDGSGTLTTTVPAKATGQLGFKVNVGVDVTTTCDVEATVDLFNAGSPVTAQGNVTSFGVPNLASCTVVGIPNCKVLSVVSTGFSWGVSTAGANATISGVNFTNTYGPIGAGTCLLTGSRTITGNVTGAVTNIGAGARLTFTNAPGLTANPGSLATVVNGSVDIKSETLGQIISLQP